MKRVVIGVVAMLMFQFCTSELSEIDGILGSHIQPGNNGGNILIPSDSFLGQYFSAESGETPISSRIEKRIRHDFSSPVKKDVVANELSAKWIGNFFFESGNYTFNIKSDKDIKVLIDDKVILESKNTTTTEQQLTQNLDGAHTVVVEYNLVNQTTSGATTNTSGSTTSGGTTNSGTTSGGTTNGGTTSSGTTSGGTTSSSEPIVVTDSGTPTVEVQWEQNQESDIVPGEGGIFYTAEELAMWRNRAKNGPFKTAGDAFPNSPGDWDRMVKDANTFLSEKNSVVWNGMTVPVDKYQDPAGSPLGQVNDPIFGSSNSLRYNRMMTAAFVDMVQETSTYKPYVKEVLMKQAQKTGVDFSNINLFLKENFSANSDIAWTFAEWQIKFLKAYDYLGVDYFTASERAILEKWFRAGAEWHQYLINVKALNKLYVQRGIQLEKYQFDNQTKSTYPIYRNGPYSYNSGSWHNNRRYGQVNFVTHVGVLLNDLSMKQTGSWAIKEYLAFHWYPDGYPMELNRSNESRPQGGLGYVPSNLTNVVEVAKVLYHDGYENLFDYSTNVSINSNTGALVQGTVMKSLEWALLQVRANFLESNAAKIFPYGSSGTSTDILMHYCSASPLSSQIKHRIKPGEPASIANNYYNNPQIKEIYWPGGGLCGYPSDPSSQGAFNTWTGTGGAYPGYMFMYAK